MTTTVPAKRTLDDPAGRLKHKTARLGPTEPSTAAPAVPAPARAAGAPLVGTRVPGATKAAVVSGIITERTIGNASGSSPSQWTVLVFMPPAFSFTFAVPATVGDAFASRHAQVYYVSTDTEYVLRAWTQGSSSSAGPGVGASAVFVSDANLALSASLGVLQRDTGHALPSTFIIDPLGVVQHADLSGTPIQTNVEETLRLLDAFQFTAQHGDQVCPANWVKGGDTISTSNPSVYFQSH